MAGVSVAAALPLFVRRQTSGAARTPLATPFDSRRRSLRPALPAIAFPESQNRQDH
jgi:hypothetical protein